jgi:hypothetical protein
MEAFVEVTDSEGKKERHPISGAQVTLGKSGTAMISLPTANELELEHLLIAPRGKEGCWVSTSQGALTPTTLKGKPFASGILKWGAELHIGRVRVRVTNKKTKAKGGKSSLSPVVVLGGLAILGAGAWMLLRPGTLEVPTSQGLIPPDLFEALDGSCSGDDGTAAERAEQAEYNGHVTGDRYQYAPGDGVEAVRYYLVAASCLREAGRTTDASEVDRFREELVSTINADYAGLRLHLEHSMAVENWADSVRDSERLVGLVSHLGDDPYGAWLGQTLRISRARAQLAEQEAAAQR